MKSQTIIGMVLCLLIGTTGCAPAATPAMPPTASATATRQPVATSTATPRPTQTPTVNPSPTPTQPTPTISPTPDLTTPQYQLAYYSVDEKTGQPALEIVAEDGQRVTSVYPLFGETASISAMSQPGWLPGGKELYFIAAGKAYRFNPQASYPEYVFFAGLPVFHGPYLSLHPSPTGEYLAAVYLPDDTDVEQDRVKDGQQGKPALGLLDLANQRWRRVPVFNQTADPGPEGFSLSSAPWSPNGSSLAFSAMYDDLAASGLVGRQPLTFLWGAGNLSLVDLFTTTPNGSLFNLTKSAAAEEDRPELLPLWSPDGGSIYFFSSPQDTWGIERINPDGKERRSLTPAMDNYMALSPDGSQFLFIADQDGAPHLYKMNADGAEKIDLSTNTLGVHSGWGPSWSPDGSRVLFSCMQDGWPELCVVQSDGSGLTRLTTGPEEDVQAAWSPDGRRIAFISAIDSTQPYEGLYLMNADGSGLRRLGSADRTYSPVWSPLPLPANQ